ncbi:MAG: glycosyltransferase family 2 protein [Candidatus Latescibacteria bacterium]|jgi:GT2 family glycosyltransferase|nr:glycosyltransferase family 2 protein [Candidatus Latescibacterota bacterium]
MIDAPLVTIIIPIHNGILDTLECLDSLKLLEYANLRLLVVDNGSSDNSAEAISSWRQKNTMALTVITVSQNLGFTGGCNFGIRHAQGLGTEYILLLNNDTVVTPDFLSVLVEVSENNDDVGAVGPKIFQFNTDRIIDSAGVSAITTLGQPFLRGHGLPDRGQFDEQTEVPYVTGCALLIKSTVIDQIGLLDTDYVSYFEDFDWGLRIIQSGYRCLYVPHAVIEHKGSQTTQFESPTYYYFHTRNRIIFARKHVSWIPFLFAFLPYFVLYRYVRPAAKLLFHLRFQHFRTLNIGCMEGLTVRLTKPETQT